VPQPAGLVVLERGLYRFGNVQRGSHGLIFIGMIEARMNRVIESTMRRIPRFTALRVRRPGTAVGTRGKPYYASVSPANDSRRGPRWRS
jgi:hypothetical protein